MFRFLLALALALPFPALAQSSFPYTVSTKSKPISITTATTTELIPGVTAQAIGVTAFNVIASGSGTIKFVSGDPTTCANPVDLTGAYSLAAASGLSSGAGIGLVLILPPAKSLCAVTSAAVTMSGLVAYVQF